MLTQEQLDMIWNERGLKLRIGRLRDWLVERGLKSFISSEKLQRHFYEVLLAFFVKDHKETENGQKGTTPTP